VKKLSIPILGQGDPNRPKDVHLVGRYALGVDWTDGHGSIYPFDHLRASCPCGACGDVSAAPAAATWPQEIKKLDTAGSPGPAPTRACWPAAARRLPLLPAANVH
jgi:hypothetical protein